MILFVAIHLNTHCMCMCEAITKGRREKLFSYRRCKIFVYLAVNIYERAK